MVLLYYIPVFFCLVSCVSADSWDDFANNLATDLAPLITLFGEQITRQCMSELIDTLDDFIFALAPLGILTAVVSAIRVCGNSTFRAMIGRAQEDPASSEKEILSCVSESTAEIFTESGIARITGSPKILEIVADESQAQSGVVTVRTVSEVTGKLCADSEKDVNLPNLSLNKGIRRRPPFWFRLAATLGVALQLGIILYAALTVMYWPQAFLKDGSPVDSYAFPMFVLGTIILTLGMFLCAVLVERRSIKDIKTLPEKSRVYWVQPGNQTDGDQKFPSFVGRTEKGVYFIRSVRHDSPNNFLGLGKDTELILVVGLTMIGFVVQFVGIRGLHSSVSLAQLGATMVMTVVRTGLRAERMQEGENMLKDDQDIVSSGEHELDWLVFHLFNIRSFKICPSYSSYGASSQNMPGPIIREPILTRKRLRKLAGSDWDETPVRKMGQSLGQATYDLMRIVSSWCNGDVPYFDIVIPFEIQKEGDQQATSHIWQTRLMTGKEVDIDFWEAIVGLYVWSLKKANHCLIQKSPTEFFRTFSPRELTSHQARLLYRAWTNDRSPFNATQSVSRYFLSECRTFGHLDMTTNNKVENDTAIIEISSDIYTLVAQDIYMQILHSVLEPLPAIGGKTQITGSDKSNYRLSNEHVEALSTVFSTAGFGDHKQSLACILPVLADRSLLSEISSGLPDVRQSMEEFGSNEDFNSLIEMSEWLCSLADYNEVQPSIVEYAHICLNILLNPDVAIQELAVERIVAIVDVTDGGRLSRSISKRLDISSVPSENWRNKFRAEIAWMVSQIIHSLKSQSSDKRLLTLLQILETKVAGSGLVLSETYNDLEAAASSRRTFFDLWIGSNIKYSHSSNQSTEAALDWLIHNGFTILLELLVIKMINEFSGTSRLLEVIVYSVQKDYTEAISILLHHTERTKRRHDIICKLSRLGDVETLKAFFGKRGSFGIITRAHESSFLIAAQGEHYTLLKFLLEGGVDVNLQDSNGETALMKAAVNGDIDSAKILFSFNARLDQQDETGETALIYAAENGHLNLVEFLISKGADVNRTGCRGRTALMAAALRRDMQILRYLCEHNADVHIRDLDKYNVLDLAQQEGFMDPWIEGCAYLEALGAKRFTGVQYLN